MQQELTKREMEKRVMEFLNSPMLRQIILYLAAAAVGAILLVNLQYLMSFFS
jgi:hypothetical protein